MTRRSIIALAIAALSAAACGGSSSDVANGAPPVAGQAVVVVTAPGETTLQPGASFRFVAQVTGTADSSVVWSVDEADGGLIDATGLYTAPSIEGTYHVRAVPSSLVDVAAASPSKKGGASIVRVGKNTVGQAVAISIFPATATLGACGTLTFAASVTNTPSTAVDWSVIEAGGGTVSSGAYVAPNAPGIYQVMAVSQADPTKTAKATVTVGPEEVISVVVTPGSSTVQASGTLAFSALVTTTCGTFAAQ